MARNPYTVSATRLGRFLVARRRLMSSVACGLLLLVFLPPNMRDTTRYLLAWDLTAAIYVVFAFWMIARSTVQTCHWRAALYDEQDWAIILMVVASAAASFGAIFFELAAIKPKNTMESVSLVVTGATVLLSWTFTHVVFTMHYANLYYRNTGHGHHAPAGGLRFPGDRPPDYRDFLYYSFVIGCAAQTADVETESRAMRMVSLAHGIISFAFNTAILALTINIAASLFS